MKSTDGAEALPRAHAEQRDRLAALPAVSFPADPALSAFVADACGAAAGRPRLPASENPCALMPDALALLEELLDRLRPRAITEFGSGRSTGLFAGWARRNGARVISVEHDPGWARRVDETLPAEDRAHVELMVRPLTLRVVAGKLALTFRGLGDLAAAVRESAVVLLDGPHASGREAVLRLVLQHAAPGATIVIDDYNHYAIREMLIAVPPRTAGRFAGAAIDDNSHGLYVLRCLAPASGAPGWRPARPREILRSFWRCYRDYRMLGRGL
jgi:predicted O-methyltransferase YrrM